VRSSKKIFYVYMHNHSNPKDDEVFKVKAFDEDSAKELAEFIDSTERFTVSWVMSSRQKRNSDKEFLRDYKWWSTDYTHVKL